MRGIIMVMMLLLSIPVSYSHAGCLKPAGDFYVHLSTSPIVPVADEQNSFLFSFGGKGGLISDVSGTITIVQNEKILLLHSFHTNDGLYGLKHTFNESGIYEIYTEFDYNGTRYVPDEFIIEAIEKNGNGTERFNNSNVLLLLAGIVLGMLLSRIAWRRK